MAAPVNVSIPPGLELTGSYTVRFTALDASTGDDVTDVVISGATVQYTDSSAPTVTVQTAPYSLIPGP